MEHADHGGVFYRLLHPRPTVIITSECPDGKVDLMPASWNAPVSEEPPTIVVAVDESSYTLQCLEHSGEAAINIAPLEMADLAYKLGSTGGRSLDKAKAFNFALMKGDIIRTPGVAGSIAVYECRIEQKVDVGEVRLYIFRVLKVKALKDAVDEWEAKLERANPLLHGAGRSFYGVNPQRV